MFIQILFKIGPFQGNGVSTGKIQTDIGNGISVNAYDPEVNRCSFLVGHRNSVTYMDRQTARRCKCVRLLLLGEPIRIRHHLLNEGIVVQCFRVDHFTIDNTGLCQPFTDGNRVHIVQTVIFLLGVELLCLDKLRDPALDVRPGQLCFSSAVHCNQGQRRLGIKAELLGQPCCSAAFPAMVLHITHYGALTLDPAVP